MVGYGVMWCGMVWNLVHIQWIDMDIGIQHGSIWMQRYFIELVCGWIVCRACYESCVLPVPFMSQFVWCRYVLYSVHVLFCSILHRLVRCCYALCFPLFCSSNSRKHVTVSYRCWIELFRCMRNSLTLDGNILRWTKRELCIHTPNALYSSAWKRIPMCSLCHLNVYICTVWTL